MVVLSASDDEPGLLLPVLAATLHSYLTFMGLQSVTDEQARAVEKSHALQNTPAASLRQFSGTHEHLLKLNVEAGLASVCDLQL
jgi:hypothetical protein